MVLLFLKSVFLSWGESYLRFDDTKPNIPKKLKRESQSCIPLSKNSSPVTEIENSKKESSLISTKSNLEPPTQWGSWGNDIPITYEIFETFFIDSFEQYFPLYQSLISAYIFYEKFVIMIQNKKGYKLKCLSRYKVFAISFLIALKITCDLEDVTIFEFVNHYVSNFPNNQLKIFSKYEFEICSSLNWDLFIDRETYFQYTKMLQKRSNIKEKILNELFA